MAKISNAKINKIIKAHINDVQQVEIPISDTENIVLEIKQCISYGDFLHAYDEGLEFIRKYDKVLHKYMRDYEHDVFMKMYLSLKYFTNMPIDIVKQGDTGNEIIPEAVAQIWNIAQCVNLLERMDNVFMWRQLLAVITQEADRSCHESAQSKFWDSLSVLADKMNTSFENMTPEDMQKISDVVSRLANIGDKEIIDAMR